MSSTKMLLTSLRTLGVRPSIGEFSERKRNQKLAYLIQEVADVPLGYDFSWYIHGPYSPNLTRDLYAEDISSATNPMVSLSAEQKDQIGRLGEFLGDDIKSPDALELLVSLHFLRKLGKNYGASKEEVIEVLKQKKPFFSEKDVERAWIRLENLQNY
jgi:hypothetical protein